MQKRLVTILILLLTLIFGSEASAWTGLSRAETGSRAPEAWASNLHLTDKQTFKKVGLVRDKNMVFDPDSPCQPERNA